MRTNMACEACNAKFSLFTRKKQCMDCKRYFCSECVIKRLGKILSCDSCNMLSRRPLIRSLIVQLHSKDLRQYLLAKNVSIKYCIEKEDLIQLLILFANGTNDHCNTEDTENADNRPINQLVTENSEHNPEILNQMHDINATRMARDEIAGPVSIINVCPDERAGHISLEEEEISKVSDTTYSNAFPETHMNPVKLSDINTLSDLENLNVKQLKKLLSVNRVDYKGCIERCELLNKASMLWKEYKQSRTEMKVLDENLCKICWDEPIECVILECGHMACCLSCGKQMSECPICKQSRRQIVRSFTDISHWA